VWLLLFGVPSAIMKRVRNMLAHGELVVVETDEDGWLGTAEVRDGDLVVRSGFRGHPVVVAIEDVERITLASEHEDCES
jgi:hypothetical protein